MDASAMSYWTMASVGLALLGLELHRPRMKLDSPRQCREGPAEPNLLDSDVRHREITEMVEEGIQNSEDDVVSEIRPSHQDGGC